MEGKKIIRLISSVLISIALWVYVINVVNPSSTTIVKNVPVKLNGTQELLEGNMAIVGNAEYTVDVVVRAPRTNLATLSPDNLVATADVSGLTLGQDYITVNVKAPTGYTVDDIRSRKIQVYVDELEYKQVEVSFEGTAAAGGCETAALDINPNVVSVYGAKQFIDNLDSYIVKVDPALLSGETPVTLACTGEATDALGNVLKGVSCVEQQINVTAALYQTKKVPLKCEYTGDVWKGASINNLSMPNEITVKGPMSVLSDVSEIIADTISIEGAYESRNERLKLHLPDEISVAAEDKDISFVLSIADTGTIDFKFMDTDITVKYLAEGLSIERPTGGRIITASVTGPVGVLRTMSESDIAIEIDASKFSSGTREAKLIARSSVSGVNINLAPASINLTVK